MQPLSDWYHYNTYQVMEKFSDNVNLDYTEESINELNSIDDHQGQSVVNNIYQRIVGRIRKQATGLETYPNPLSGETPATLLNVASPQESS